MANNVTIKLEIDSSGAVRSVNDVKGSVAGANVEMKNMESLGVRIGRVFEFAIGQIVAQLFRRLAQQVSQFVRNLGRMAEEIADTENAFRAMFWSVQSEADATARKLADLAAFTTMQSKKMVQEIGGIGLSMGATADEALRLSEEVVTLASQWERLSGLNIEQGVELIQRAMTGRFMMLQQQGIVLNQTLITERALVMTGKEHADQLREVERAQAAVSLITEKLGNQYGSLGQATEGLTQGKRRLITRFAEVREEIVIKLIPTFEKLIGFVNSTLSENEDLTEQIKTGLLIQLEALNKALGNIIDTLSGGEENLGFTERIFGFINDKIANTNMQLGRLVVGFSEMLRQMPPGMRAAAIAFGLTEERLNDLADIGADLILRGAGLGDTMDDLADKAQATTEVLAGQGRVIGEVTRLTREAVHGYIGFSDAAEDIATDIEHIIDPLEMATTLISRFGADGRVAIEDMNSVLQGLNDEILRTFDPERRELLVQYREELTRLRNEAQATGQSFVDMSMFMQQSMSMALTQFVTDFTNAFEAVGAGSGSMSNAIIKSLLSVIRGIGHTMIAQGIALILGAYTPGGPLNPLHALYAAAGKKLVAQGTIFSAGGALASGLMSRGGGGGGGGTGAGRPDYGQTGVNTGGLRKLPTGGITQNSTASLKQALSEIKWKVTTDVKLGKLIIEMENEQRKISGTL
jgi:hypothetical protein